MVRPWRGNPVVPRPGDAGLAAAATRILIRHVTGSRLVPPILSRLERNVLHGLVPFGP